MSSPAVPLLGRVRSLDRRLLDGVLALGLSVWALFDTSVLHDTALSLARVAMTISVAWRMQAPVAVLLAQVVGVAALPNNLQLPQGVALLLAAYSAALYSQRRLLVLALVAAAGGLLVRDGTGLQIPGGLAPFLLLGPAWLAGVAMRNREQRAEASDARAERLERERAEALRAERARIARELHDVVTHSVSVMVLQTGAARQIMSQDEQRGRALLQAVESSGRTALEELRGLLGILTDEGDEAPLSPQPAIGEIPALVEQVRDAGLPVELRVDGRPHPVSPGVAITAYRIVQEALTNVLKHAPGAPTTVTVIWHDTALELEILDRGSPHRRRGPDGESAGRGLTGMRERAAVYGGTLQAGLRPEGGYVVHARIPLGPSLT